MLSRKTLFILTYMKLLRQIFLILLAFLMIWVGGFLWFMSQVDSYQISAAEKTDAIIVLTGGSERVAEGLRLLDSKYADKLFFSGAGKGVKASDLYKTVGKKLADADTLRKVEIGYEAGDTVGNATETSTWVKKKGLKSIRLVTSNYHMPRSLLEFGLKMPDVKIIPHPVVPENVKIPEWWKYKGTRELMFSEYNKFLAASIKVSFQKRKQQQ